MKKKLLLLSFMILVSVNSFGQLISGSITVTGNLTQNATNLPVKTLDQDAATKWADTGAGTGSPSAPTGYGDLTYTLDAIYTLQSISIVTSGNATSVPEKYYYYQVQFSTDGLAYTTPVAINTQGAGTAAKSFPFTNEARYIKILGGGNTTSAYSTIVDIQFYGTVLSVSKNEVSGLNIYPNPVTNGVVYITSDSSESKEVVIYDLLGRQLIQKEVSNGSLNLSSLEKGTYLMKVSEGTASSTKKIVIQ